MLAGVLNDLRRIAPRRIVQWQNAEQLPGAVPLPSGHTQRAEAAGREFIDALLGGLPHVGPRVTQIEDHLRRPLGDVERPAVAGADVGVRTLAFGVKWRETELLVCVQHAPVREAADDRIVDRVAILRLGREGGREQQILLIVGAEHDRLAEREFVGRQRARLVGAKHVDAGDFLDRLKPRHNRLHARERDRSQCHRDGQNRRHGHRNGGHHQNQHELKHRQERVPAQQLREHQHRGQAEADVDQVVADAQHGPLKMRHRTGAFHQLGGFRELRAFAGGGHQRDHLALLGDGPGIRDVPRLLVHREGFAGQSGLVDAQVVAIDQFHVCRNDVPGANADDIARNQFPRGNLLPFAVAQRAGRQRQTLPQCRQRVGRLELLPEADDGVEDQHDQNDDQVNPVLHDPRKDGCDLDHPGDRPPEVAEELQQRVFPLLGQFVGTDLLQASLRLFARQPVGRILDAALGILWFRLMRWRRCHRQRGHGAPTTSGRDGYRCRC